jgi:CRP-like cAMP-binding protein
MLPATVLFRSLSDEELMAARSGFVVLAFEDGDVILREGDGGKSIFVIVTGAVKVSVMNPDGRDFQIAALGEGDFFGEIAAISGRPRGATVMASGACTVLEIQKPILDSIARHHAEVRTLLEECYVERVSSPDAAAVRAVSIPAAARDEADEALRSHFGESRWGARMRLRLADVLVQAGQAEPAVSILMAIADDLDTAGQSGKAVALLKKIQRIRHRHVEELCLAPLVRLEPPDPSAPEPKPATPAEAEASKRRSERARTREDFRGWLGRVLRDTSES